jgi:hypothetical protein
MYDKIEVDVRRVIAERLAGQYGAPVLGKVEVDPKPSTLNPQLSTLNPPP